MKCKLLRERAELDHDYHCVCDQATTDDDDDDDDIINDEDKDSLALHLTTRASTL